MEISISHKLVATAFGMLSAFAITGPAFVDQLQAHDGQIVRILVVSGIIVAVGLVPASILVQIMRRTLGSRRRGRT